MRYSIPVAAALAALLGAGFDRSAAAPPAAPAKADRLAPPVAVELDGKPQESGYPFLGDIDGDGRPDLLVGGDTDGRLRVFRNVGPRGGVRLAAPVWFDETVPTGRVPRGCAAAYFYPQLADFDGDGRPDLLTGSNCCDPAGFHVFRRTADGWAPRQRCEVSAGKAGGFLFHRSFVTAADWDGDGVPDLLWRAGGNRGIAVALGPFKGTGPHELAHTIEFTPRPATVDEGVQDMAVADWDGDGNPDLLVHLSLDVRRGGIYWYRNLGGPGLKRLAAGELLLGEAALAGPTPAARRTDGFCVGDWDGDGRPDLLVTRQDLTPPGPAGVWRGSTWLYRRM